MKHIYFLHDNPHTYALVAEKEGNVLISKSNKALVTGKPEEMMRLLETDKYVYIIEIKTDSSADEALRQIAEKGYVKPFAADSRKVFKIGVSFSSRDRSIEDWKVV